MHWNLSTDPLGWAVGPNVRLDHRLSGNWTLGPAYFYFNRMLKTVQTSDSSYGLYVSYSFSQAMTHSWFLDVAAFYGRVYAEAPDSTGQAEAVHIPNYTERVMLGHQWYWGHFSLDVSVGEEFNSAGHSPIRDQSGNTFITVPIYPMTTLVDTSIGLVF